MKVLAQLAESLLAGREPPRAAAMFLGSALSAWLAQGGNLERDFLRVTAPAGSHRTPARLLSSSRGQQPEALSDSVAMKQESKEKT